MLVSVTRSMLRRIPAAVLVAFAALVLAVSPAAAQ